MSTQEHKKEAPKKVKCKVITVSDTRNSETDKSGQLMMELLEQAGHKIVDYVIVKDEAEPIQNEILKGCEQKKLMSS